MLKSMHRMKHLQKRFLFPTVLKITTATAETICSGCDSSLEDFDHDTNSKKNNNLIGSARQRAFSKESVGPAEAHRYSMVLNECMNKWYGSAKVFLLYCQKTLTTMSPVNSEFAYYSSLI